MAKGTITESEQAEHDREAHGVPSAEVVAVQPDDRPAEPSVDVFRRLRRGALQILGFACAGFVAGAALVYGMRRNEPVTTSARVAFSFPGFERGEYPDRSHFQPDDLRAPHVIREALQRQGLAASPAFQAKIRNALRIQGLIAPEIVSERDRRRASGQRPPAYVPDEYTIRLALPRNAELAPAQRESLLEAIVAVYRDNFRRSYGEPPAALGQAFSALRAVDFAEYELILTKAVGSITGYLEEQASIAGSFRSPSTHFSFKDLIEQAELFSEIHLNETLGLIQEHGLSRDRDLAMAKMNYHLRLLGHQERLALEQEMLIKELLTEAQGLSSDYVVGIKSQAVQSADATAPLLDQSLIDSLLANDASNFLIREALEVGMNLKQIQAERAKFVRTRESMQTFLESAPGDQSAIFKQVAESITALERAYQQLLENVRATYADFAKQRYGNAVRLNARPSTASLAAPVAAAGGVGAGLGLALGTGLSLLGFYAVHRRS